MESCNHVYLSHFPPIPPILVCTLKLFCIAPHVYNPIKLLLLKYMCFLLRIINIYINELYVYYNVRQIIKFGETVNRHLNNNTKLKHINNYVCDHPMYLIYCLYPLFVSNVSQINVTCNNRYYIYRIHMGLIIYIYTINA